MNKIWLLAVFCLLMGTARSNGAEAPDGAELSSGLQFQKVAYDLGEIAMGQQYDVCFAFSTQAKVAVIFSVATNCSCTTAEYPRKPLNRNETYEIRVKYDAREPGYFRKTLTVKYIADGVTLKQILTITGTVSDPQSK